MIEEENEIIINVSSSSNINASISGNSNINTNINSSDSVSSSISSSSGINTNIEGYGPPGPKGADGITWIPEIEAVNTINYDEEASASVRTLLNKMLFIFNIPKGQPGDMSKSVYDTNDNGNVDNADNALSLDGLSKTDILNSLDDLGNSYTSLDRALSTFESYIENKIDSIETPPIGIISPFGGINAPPGWLICDGSAVSRILYDELFQVIGTTYGSGDGSTTFNLPDLRKKIPIGYSSSDQGYDTLGNSIGNETHSLSVDELAKHNHSGSTGNAGGHNHFMYNKWNSYAAGDSSGNGFTSPGNGWNQDGWADNYTGSVGDHSHSVTIENTGKGDPFSLIQPSMLMNYIIKC